MIGVVLAGGNGTRLRPLTNVTNKHLLPVYDKLMIQYPLELLKGLGVRDVVLITGREFAGDFANLLGEGTELGMDLTYRVQNGASGIAHAIGITEKVVRGEPVITILGDNIFSMDEGEMAEIRKIMEEFGKKPEGAVIFLKKVDDPWRFGVATVKDGKVVEIEEKPKSPKSDLAVTGLYIYDNTVFQKIRRLKPSGRNELEITDVNNMYIEEGRLSYHTINGEWTDAGTFESLYKAHTIAREKALKAGGKE